MNNPTYYLTATGNGVLYSGALPAGAVACTQDQYDNFSDWQIDGGEIVPNQNLLANMQAAQMLILSDGCRKQIVSGFASASLGAAHTYASDAIDQRNILLAAQSANGGLLSCADSTGAWSRKPHTQTQAQQVAADFVATSDTARVKLVGLEAQVNAATTVAAVRAVTWGA